MKHFPELIYGDLKLMLESMMNLVCNNLNIYFLLLQSLFFIITITYFNKNPS